MTAIEVAWGRVYTASGPSGVVKAWTPLWEDATKEKVILCFSAFSACFGVPRCLAHRKKGKVAAAAAASGVRFEFAAQAGEHRWRHLDVLVSS